MNEVVRLVSAQARPSIARIFMVVPIPMSLLKKLFNVPHFAEDSQSYTARMLRVVLSFLAILTLVYTTINIATDSANSLRYALQFGFGILSLAAMTVLIHKGQPRAASILLIFSAWAIFTSAAFSGGGIRSSAYLGYLVVLTMAGLVAAQPKWTLFATILCAASGYGLLSAEKKGLLPASSVPGDGFSIWIDSLVFFALVASLQILASRITLDSLRRARRESQERQDAEQREKRRAALMRVVIELGKEVTQTADLDWCLKKIHQSIQKGLGFERVGLFLYDESSRNIQGTYGTDRHGSLEDTSWFKQNTDEYEAWKEVLQAPEGISKISNYAQKNSSLPPESEMYGVQEHITLAAWAGKQPIAIIAVDNALSNTPIEAEKIEALRLFAGYAGLAIVNARNLEALNQELESFSYAVSHDLRSPLRAVVGFSQILMNDFEQNKDGDSLQYLKKINENGKKMGNLIDDLLNFSRVGRQTLRIVTCDNQSIVENIIESLKEKYPARQARWKLGNLPACQADYALIQQAWLNLLENASKYCLSNPDPLIEIGSLQENEQTIYFVRDNGEGFDMQYADKIFHIFQHLSPENEFNSTGIGLTIVQRVLQRHGGKIWAVSSPGEGATFYFKIS
jgi:signal transduction histidine kinase